MSEMLVGILGFVCIIAIVITLPSIAFITFPMILGVILVLSGYYTWDNLAKLIKSGFSSTGPTAALFVFSVLYFGIMTDAGMFDVIINNHAGPALTMCSTLMAAAVLMGVLVKEVEGTTSVITCMSGLISTFLPAVLGRHLPLVIGILSVPLALPIAAAMAVCRNCATFISPMVPATLLGVGLADVDINQHIKSNFLWVWGFSFICMIAAILFGIIPV